MTGQSSAFENSYFAARCAAITEECVYWDILRKVPLLPGAIPELLEVVAAVLGSNAFGEHAKHCLLVPISDHYLFRDLQALGCRWAGYGVATNEGRSPEAASAWALWDGLTGFQVEPLKELDSLLACSGKVLRYVLDASGELAHDPSFDSSNYFRFVKSHERYFAGLTSNQYLRSKTLWSDPVVANTSSVGRVSDAASLARAIPSFHEVVQQRKSASTLSGDKSISRAELEAVFEDSYYQRSDGHFPVGSAGGFANFRLLLVVERCSEVADGCYEIDPVTRTWRLKNSNVDCALIHQAGFSQEIFHGCTAWLAILADIEQPAKKYGNRAYRFSMMGAGGLSHALHLSCVSYGIDFRLMGGFDDGMMEKVLSLDSNQGNMIAVMVGLKR